MKLDLHGYPIHDAWKEYRRVTQECYWKDKKYIVVVTGIGQMQSKFHHWVSSDPYAIKCEQLNEGAWKVTLKKRTQVSVTPVQQSTDISPLLTKYKK